MWQEPKVGCSCCVGWFIKQPEPVLVPEVSTRSLAGSLGEGLCARGVRPSCLSPPRWVGLAASCPHKARSQDGRGCKHGLDHLLPLLPLSCLQGFLELGFLPTGCAGSALQCLDLSLPVILPPRGSPKHPVPTNNLPVVWRVAVIRIRAVQTATKRLSRHASSAITVLKPIAAAAVEQGRFEMQPRSRGLSVCQAVPCFGLAGV